jgi:hypothetical protein
MPTIDHVFPEAPERLVAAPVLSLGSVAKHLSTQLTQKLR